METGSFFTRLKTLGSHVETKVKILKQDLSQPPGHNPERYDKGLNRLKKDIQELKEMSEDIKESLLPFSKFSSYLKDAKELVEEQIAGTEKMEQYCAQYGFVIPPKPAQEITPIIKATTPEASGSGEKDPVESSSRDTENYQQVTPELIIHGQMVLQQKELPLLSTAKKAVSVVSSHISADTPITSRIPSTLETPCFPTMGSSISKPYMLMEDWMAGGKGREESIALTPDVINTKAPQRNHPLLTREEKEVEKLEHIQKTPLQATTSATNQTKALVHENRLVPTDSSKGVVPNKITTPTEPSLSGFMAQLSTHSIKEKTACGTTQLEEYGSGIVKPQVTHIATPEEPVLLSQQNPLLYTYEENGTPEEPILHYKENMSRGMMQKEMPEEPILTYHENLPYRMRGPANDADIPKEPVLLSQQRTPKALSVCSALKKPKDFISPKIVSCRDENNEIPKTPELSDVTRSILSLVSHQAPPQPQQDHHGRSQPHRDYKEPSYSYRNYSGSTHHHGDHYGSTQHHRDHHQSHTHTDYKGLGQPQREPQHHTQPATHSPQVGTVLLSSHEPAEREYMGCLGGTEAVVQCLCQPERKGRVEQVSGCSGSVPEE